MWKVTIKEARKMILECIDVYLQKDENGYCIPRNKQRPIYLEGPAGIGKTELASQLAQEKGLGFVSYSLTHHTRQSAVGLPAIVERRKEGAAYKATEYTMSEIVDSIYRSVQQGNQEGILFVDEVNCVSETLSAVMLQFLQNKSFGPHKIPEGWIILTAGNPPEYNKSVKLFDPVTYDRLRVIELQPDVDSWLEYAVSEGVHPLVTEYVRNNKEYFYWYEKSAGMTEIVTARGWEDLSRAVKANEAFGYEVNEALVGQFIRKESIALSFMNEYRSWRELLGKKELQEILAGENQEEHAARFAGYEFTKRWTVVSILLKRLYTEAEELVKIWKKREEEYAVVEKKMDQWDRMLTNSITFIRDAFGVKEEMEHYLSMMYRNKNTGYLLALKRNELFHSLYRKINQGGDQKEAIRKELREWGKGE